MTQPHVQASWPVPKPPYRTGAAISWVLVAVSNTLGCLLWLIALIGTLIGAGAVIGAIRSSSGQSSHDGGEVDSVIRALGGAAVGFVIAVLIVCVIVALIFTVLSWRRVWPALVVQTVCGLLAAVLFTLGYAVAARPADGSAAMPVGYLVAVWALALVWLLFAVLTAPGRARREPVPPRTDYR